jgi:hypothetical protein
MRQLLLCILLALALPPAAAAGAIDLVPGSLLTGEQALEPGAAAPPPPGLDLGRDSAGLRVAQNGSDDEQGSDLLGAKGSGNEQGGDLPQAKGDISPYEAQSDRGLSFDFEVRPRSRFGDLARKNDTEDPDLGDRLDRLIERPVFGFRGRYRF